MDCMVCVAVLPFVGEMFFLRKKLFIPFPQIGMDLYHLSTHEDFPLDGMKVRLVGWSPLEKVFYVFLELDNYLNTDENYTQEKLMAGLYADWEIDPDAEPHV